MNKHNVLKITLNIINIFSALIYFVLITEIDVVFIQKIWAIQILIPILLEIFLGRRDYVTPYLIYAISIMIFLWSRPILNSFSTVELVQAGVGQNSISCLYSMLVLGGTFSVINIFYLLFQSNNIIEIKFQKRFQINSKLIKLLWFLAISLTVVFLLMCLRDVVLIKNTSYLDIAGDFGIELKLFSLTKYLLILWLILSDSEKRYYNASLLMGIGSLGYLCIGLRGYFVMHFLLWIFFQNKKKRFKLTSLIIIAFLILLMASLILEYRLGYQLSSGIYNKIKSAFYNQGASFEVIFGVTNYFLELHKLLPLDKYLFINNFGDFVDAVRSVNFEKGGFASSFFAEIFYMGPIVTLLLSSILAAIISLLEKASKSFTTSKTDQTGLLFFVLITNLSYIARASAWDLIGRFLLCMLIMYVSTNIYVTRKHNNLSIFINKKE